MPKAPRSPPWPCSNGCGPVLPAPRTPVKRSRRRCKVPSTLWICHGRRRFRRCSRWKTLFRTSRVPWRGDAPAAGDRRPRPDDRDVPPAPPAVRLRHALRAAASVPGLRRTGQGLHPQVRSQRRRGGGGLGAGGDAPRPGGPRSALRAAGGPALAPEQGRPRSGDGAPHPGALHPRAAAQGLSHAAGGAAHRHGREHRTAAASAGALLRERGSRLADPGRRGLARPGAAARGAGRAGVLGTQLGHGRAAASDRGPGPQPAAGADRRGDGHRQELPRRARAPSPIGGEGAAGRHRSLHHPGDADSRASLRIPPGQLHRRRRGPRWGVRAGAHGDPVPRRDREPGPGVPKAAVAGARARNGHPPRRFATPVRRAQAGGGDQRGPRASGERRAVPPGPVHAPEPGHAAARAAAARAQGGPARPDPLRAARRVAIRAAPAVGARLSRPLSHARRLRRGGELGPLRQAAGPGAATRRVLHLPPAGCVAPALRAPLARQPPRAEAAGEQCAGVLAGPAPRRGRPSAARCGEGGSPIPARAGRALDPGCARRSLARQARRAAAFGARTCPLRIHRRSPGGDRAQAGRELRGDLRRGGAPISDGAVPCPRRRPGPDGRRAVRPRHQPAQGAPAQEPARIAAAQPARGDRVIALVAALLAAGAAEHGLKLLREGRPAEAAESFAAALRKDPRNAALANDLGIASARAGRRLEAERSYRLAIQLNPARWYAYGNLADLLATAPDRWERVDETPALVERGLSRASPAGRLSLALRVADFERSVGRTAQARQRLALLGEGKSDAEQARRTRELLDRISDDERSRALEDWPEPEPSAAQLAALASGAQRLSANDARGALAAADALCLEQPAWRAARWLRARALEAVGRLDEEARELRILTQLAPADAAAWRRLGRILTDQGGLLEADRADAALREALALEPSWSDLWLLRARVALRQGRAQDALRHLERFRRSGGRDAEADRLASAAAAQAGTGAQAPGPGAVAAHEPSANARALYQQAGSAESPDSARLLLQQALEDSPGFAEAAAALYAVGSAVPEKTVETLQDDGPALLDLAEHRPEAALAVVGDRCDPGMDADRLVAIGGIREFSGDLGRALECYRLASPAPTALRKLARVAGRHPDAHAADELRAAAAQGIPEALWALARIDLAAGRRDAAVANLDRFLSAAAPDDPGVADARAARDALLRKSTEEARARARRQVAASGAGAALLAGLAAWLWAGVTLQSALRRAPRLFPHLARAVNEVRHDVLKHRAGVLGMVSDPGARREDIAHALLAPEPASRVVARHYEALRAAAKAQGVGLRRLSREPVFGPLVRDLARAEELLRDPADDARTLGEIDGRVRGEHARRLGALLRMGPRTKLDASAVAGWIRDVEAEMRRGGSPWTAPSILMKGMEVEFPVERGALSTIFANLLRNAQAAAEGGEVIVRLGEERDAAGRNLIVLLVGDSSRHAVSLDAIEQRESGRGLALVRDLTREWQGHVIVRAEEPPWTKAVGACFPAPAA